MGKKLARKMYYMGLDELFTEIFLYMDGTVEFVNYTDNIMNRAFGVRESPLNIRDLEKLLEYRSFPRTRGNANELLRDLGLEFYEVFSIVEKTHGVMFDDIYWIKFEGEDITYADARRMIGL